MNAMVAAVPVKQSFFVAPPEVSQRAAKQTENKLRGMGGHMTAIILHKIKFYDQQMVIARRNEDFNLLRKLEHGRQHFLEVQRKKLQDRGYYGIL